MRIKRCPDRQFAQVSLEFAVAFVVLVIFLLATTKIFVWFGNSIVDRNKAYEETRSEITSPIDFYNQSDHPLRIFSE
ncbi:MAG: hypothetical protein V1670_03160 [Candidatus Omnitrophota bacterium]